MIHVEYGTVQNVINELCTKKRSFHYFFNERKSIINADNKKMLIKQTSIGNHRMLNLKKIVTKTPVIGSTIIRIRNMLLHKNFKDSGSYWENRYVTHGDSGEGSYDELANFKAKVLNTFVKKNKIKTITEFGSGDGNQLKLSEYKKYTGFDVSEKAITLCKNKFSNDKTKTFLLLSEWNEEIKTDLCLSLDVIYHLIENEIYTGYMEKLFITATKFVIIYSSNTEEGVNGRPMPHVRQRKFTDWVEAHKKDWKLITITKNKYPYNPESKISSISDFYIYKKIQ